MVALRKFHGIENDVRRTYPKGEKFTVPENRVAYFEANGKAKRSS